jgi:uncharacterized caspase-like protein
VFAGKSGSRCIDGSEKSPLTAALLKHLATPELDIRVALGRVQDEVRQATDNRQEPVVNGGGALGGSVLALVQPPAQPAPSVASPPTVASLPIDASLPAKPERLALVIGNAAYPSGELKNVINDAQSVSSALALFGFEVTAATNVKGDDLDRTLREFLSKASATGKDAAVLVYYAGQGVEIEGENFVIPVDLKIRSKADLTFGAVPLSTVLSGLSRLPAATRIVIFDTSRSNPFEASPVTQEVRVPPGTVVAFSTSAGGDAVEGADANSPFTAALLDASAQPGLNIEGVFQRVRDQVSKETQGEQVPQVISSLTSAFAFLPASPESSVAGKRADDEARKDYELARVINSVEAWEAFLRVHPSGFHAVLARAKLSQLKAAP